MRVRNVIAHVRFAKVILLEFSEAGTQPLNDALPLNNICHECIHCMRNLDVVRHQTRWLPLEDKVLPALLESIKASAMVSYKRFRRVEAGCTGEMRHVYASIYRPFTM
jgi:hypothetical protein